MSTLVVTGVVETLCYGTPLHGEVLIVVERSCLVDTPTHRAMVDDDVVAIASPERICTIVNIYGIATANAYETNDYVVCLVLQSVVAECDTITRGCLTFYRNITILNGEVALQCYCTRNIKYDNSFTRCVLQSLTE